MRYMGETTDGKEVELLKDCDCVTHEGPHWLHIDRFDREQARRQLSLGNLAGFAVIDKARLDEKLYQFRSRRLARAWEEP